MGRNYPRLIIILCEVTQLEVYAVFVYGIACYEILRYAQDDINNSGLLVKIVDSNRIS
jgi:hypothetical protein